MSEAPTTPTDGQESLPKRTTPTWEMELLISGVSVFALLQLGSSLDEGYEWLALRLRDAPETLAMLVYVYLRCATSLLALTFVLHLALRAAWVALVGARSVHPGGIRWEALRLGRLQREHYGRRYASFDDVIERADNRASVVFALGVAVSLLMLFPIVLVLLAFAATMLLGLIPALSGSRPVLLAGAIVVAILPLFLVQFIDRRFGDRVPRGGRLERGLRRVLAAYDFIGAGRHASPILALLSSRLGERRVQVGVAVVAMLMAFSFIAATALRSNTGYLGYDRLPAPSRGAHGVVLPAHYAPTRRPGDVLPFIEAQVVDGPYLRLVVPLMPRAHEPAVARSCPEIQAASGQEAVREATLACLSRLHAVRIDGAAVPGLAYDVTEDSLTDLRALQAMIRVDGLTPGRHELEVDALPAAAPRPPYVIPFWR